MTLQDFKKAAKTAHEKQLKDESVKEAGKLGILRGGSAGALVGDKAYYSQCGRLAQARLLGKQIPPTQSMRMMFNGGYTLENAVEDIFKNADIEYVKENDRLVNHPEIGYIGMRPDFEIMTASNGWLGVEVKSLASPFSVIKQKKNGFPFMKHLVQSATYMTFLGRDKWIIVIGQSFNTNQNGKKIDSGLEWYSLSLVGMNFVVENELGKLQELPFDSSHILAYYKEVKAANKEQRLMIRPTEKELNVDTYDRCKYCPMQSACNEYDAKQIDFETWLSRVETSKEKNQGD